MRRPPFDFATRPEWAATMGVSVPDVLAISEHGIGMHPPEPAEIRRSISAPYRLVETADPMGAWSIASPLPASAHPRRRLSAPVLLALRDLWALEATRPLSPIPEAPVPLPLRTPSSVVSSRVRKVVLRFLAATNLALMTDFSLLTAFFPRFATTVMAIDYLMLGLISAAQSFAELMCTPVVPRIYCRIGRAATFISGLLIIALSKLPVVFLPAHLYDAQWSFVVFAVSRFFSGVGYAFIKITAYSFIMSASTNLIKDIGFQEGWQGLGYAIGPLIGAVMYEQVGLRWTFIGCTLPFVALALAFGLVVAPRLPREVEVEDREGEGGEGKEEAGVPLALPTPSLRDWAAIFRPSVVAVTLIPLLTIMAERQLDLVYSMLVGLQLGASEEIAGVLFLVESATYALSAPLVHILTARLGLRRTLMIGLIVHGLAYVAVGPAPFLLPTKAARAGFSPMLAWVTSSVSVAAMGASCTMLLPPSLAALLSALVAHPPRNVRVEEAAAVLHSGACAVGELLGPFVAGLLADNMPRSPVAPCTAQEPAECYVSLQTTLTTYGLAFWVACLMLARLPKRRSSENR